MFVSLARICARGNMGKRWMRFSLVRRRACSPSELLYSRTRMPGVRVYPERIEKVSGVVW